MKSRLLFFLLLIFALLVLLTRNNHAIQDALLDVVTPIKQTYNTVSNALKDRGKSYIFQKENIQRLTKENKTLRKYLLDQTYYIQQVSTLFKKIPSLEKLPHHSMELVDTISYIKLNSFSEILLTRPRNAKIEKDQPIIAGIVV